LKDVSKFNVLKVTVFMLIPMILLIAYLYYIKQSGYEDHYLVYLTLLVLAISFALFGAKWVEERHQRKLQLLIKELEHLKENEKFLQVSADDDFSGIAQSVNELKQHLSSYADQLSLILDSLPLGVIYYDAAGMIKSINERALAITGFSKEEIADFTAKGNILNGSEHVFWETLRSGQSFLGFESYCPTKDGKEIPVMTSTNPLFDKFGTFHGTISSFIDISEQDRLRKIEYKAKVMLDHISDGVIMVDNFGIINGFNRGAEEMTGLKASQVMGKKYDDIFIKRKTIFTKLTQTLSTKEEYINYKKETTTEDGRKINLMITTKLIWDEVGQQIGAMGIYKDITHLEELAQQVQRADKLAIVGELAAGTAHEIRNPLTTINGFIQLIGKDSLDGHTQQYIELILKEIDHINEIIKEMILLAKPAYPSKALSSINSIIKDIEILMIPEAILYNVEIKSNLQSGLPYIELDERQIKQVFINLIKNGLQAMPGGGTFHINSAHDANNRRIEVTFTDEGEGIPQDRLAKIFEPFFTTKEEGTGLGLPVSYRIMKNHNGDLHIKSVFGEGTKVTLFFPINYE